MSRTQRATIAASFGYLQFALSIGVGIVMVPFVLNRVGVTLYGYWLASGDVLAYAAMADLGVLGVLPWMIAQADGRKDRDGIRRLLSTGFCAAIVVSILYVGVVLLLWRLAPAVLNLDETQRALVAGPLALIAGVTAVVLPLRVAYSALIGLQDVRYCGAMSTVWWTLDALLTVALLVNGYGLWALAIGASVPSALGAIAAIVRLRIIAPDLLAAWPRPTAAALTTLFKEGSGGWLGAWGWRLASATDSIVIASLGHPAWITMLAMTAKLGQMLTNMAWLPGDSGLVGLAQLAGEGQGARLRAAVAALFRVYLALATTAACVVLAANAAFVRGWVGPDLFAGWPINVALAAVALGASAVHALTTSVSVLGKRLHVGLAALAGGVAQVVLALVLGRKLGLIGIPLAALLVHGFVLMPLLIPALRAVSGVGPRQLLREVVLPWSARAVPLLAVAGMTGLVLGRAPMWLALAVGAATGMAALFVSRHLIFDYPPVANLLRPRLARLRLDGLLMANPPAPRA